MEKLRTQEEIISLWKGSFSEPKVSICCTTFNHESYVEDAMTGFLMQETDFPIEILIHDDASSDKTQEIVRKYEKKYPNIIKPIYQTENQYSKGKRVNYTFNYTRAKGKYIALCEGDDYWTDKDKLQRQVELLENNEEVMLCMHATGVFNVDENLLEPNKIRLNNGDRSFHAEDIINGGGDFGHTSSFVFRRGIIEKPPQWFLDSPSGDTPLRLLCAHIGTVYYLDQDMSVYRKGVVGSWTRRVQNNEKFINHWTRNFKMFEEYNEFTNHNYSRVIKKKLSHISYKILLKLDSSNKKELQKYYSRLLPIDKVRFNLKNKLPWLVKIIKSAN